MSIILTFPRISLLSVYLFGLRISLTGSLTCELPTELKNNAWEYTRPGQSKKTVNFLTTTLQSFTLSAQGTNIDEFTCVAHQTLSPDKTILIFRSVGEYWDLNDGKNKRIYLCMKMTKVSNDLFYFFLLSDPSTNSAGLHPSERVTTYEDGISITIDSIESNFCMYNVANPPDDIRTLQRSGTSEQLPAGITLCEPFNNTCDSVTTCPDIDTVPWSTNTTSGNSVGDTISFNCTTGYEITTGDTELTCTENGTWSGTPPTCTIVSCPILPNVLQSSRIPTTPSNTYNEMVNYTCNVGYEQTSGDLTRTCQADKTWTGTTPTCTIVSCPSLPNVLKSSRIPTTPSNTYDEMVTYTCNVGYEQTSGDLTRTCQADKTWTGTTPTCNIITCGDLPNVPHSSTSPTTPSTTFESAVTYSCLSGYEHSSGTLQRQCQADKQWSGVKPVCDPVNCGTLPTVPFTSNTKTGTHYLDTITYTCSPGYVHINGSLSRKCQSDRVWDGIPPYCASTPSTPDALSNMYITVGVAGGILLLIPLVIICLLCNLKDKICPKANMKGKDIGPKERFNGSKRKGPNDYYSDYSSSRHSFRQPTKVHYPVYNPGYY